MRPVSTPRRLLAALIFWLMDAGLGSSGLAQTEPRPDDSAYIKLLKKAPEERKAQVVDIIGKRGTLDDLATLYDLAILSEGFSSTMRSKALDVLADAAITRGLSPRVDPSGLKRLIDPSDPQTSPSLRRLAIRLSGLWKASTTVSVLLKVAGSKQTEAATRASAFEALAAIGDKSARDGVEALTNPEQPASVRALGVAALARLDLDSAAKKAAGSLTDESRIDDVTPLMAAFLDRQGGADKLAAALVAQPPSPDGARLALRAVYALGRSDDALIATLSKAARLEAETRSPTREQMDALVADVTSKGDSQRGEAIFRRAELNCMKCHAITGAAGGVGPELSALGLSSPVDYVVNSILIPDQAIKEEYQTRVVLTDDGRVLQGIVVEEDDKKLILKEATGAVRVIAASSIEDSKKGGSLMPKGLANLLTRGEFVDLVRFLSELGKPGPYAIQATPTLQRWRILKTDLATIAEILQSEPDQWLPAYGEVGGALPIADLKAATPEKFVTIQGEIQVSAAGPLTIRINSTRGLNGWLDDQPLPGGEAPSVEVLEGKHKLTFRVEIAVRDTLPIRVEVSKTEGSSAEFSVVGGR